MASAATCRVALMAIHPVYADAILAGYKQVEFRKRALAPDISSVLIYATAPVQGIVGEFTVRGIVAGTPDEVWARYGEVGHIDWDSYGQYYRNSTTAYAIVIGRVKRLSTTLPLSALDPQPTIPQSFMYLDRSQLHAIFPDDHHLEQLALFPVPATSVLV